MYNKRRNTTTSIWDVTIPQTKTNKAIIFLCLFNGLRIPTIRLLARKPRTICFEPLNNFDPYLYSPTTTNILSSRYQAQIHCPSVDIRVDPTIYDVQSIIKAYGNATLSERTVIHYYGQGCLEPGNKGKMYFFDKSRTTYNGLTVTKLLDPFLSPITLIIDCDSASALYEPLRKISADKDVVAFFASQEGEKLPSSTNMPLDILSSAILDPLKSALWFHSLNAVNQSPVDLTSVFKEEPVNGIDKLLKKSRKEMGGFLSAILTSIAFSTLPSHIFQQMFHSDSSLREISKGFILATRILAYSNVHTVSLPNFPPTADAPQWGLWDLYLDAITAGTEGAQKGIRSIFNEIKTTFVNFHESYLVPLILFFIRYKKDFSEEATHLILDYIESNQELPHPCLIGIAETISKIKLPTENHFLILAKLYLAGFDEKPDISKLFYSQDDDINSAAMLILCCCYDIAQPTNQVQFLQMCAQYATTCAPYSEVLFGIVASHMTLMFSDAKKYLDAFLPLLQDHREDVRASACFAIGLTREQSAIMPLCKAVLDDSQYVSSEALISLSMLIRFDIKDENLLKELKIAIQPAISRILNSQNKLLLNTLTRVRPFIENFIQDCGITLPPAPGRTSGPQMMPGSLIPDLLKQSVAHKGFIDRFHTNFFL